MRERLAWWLVDKSHGMFHRPRGGWFAFEMQMVGHGLLGNGWNGCLMHVQRWLGRA